MYEEYIKQLHIDAKLRNLADSSIKTYTDFILRFLEYTGKDPQDISAQAVRDFLLFNQETIAATTLNLKYSRKNSIRSRNPRSYCILIEYCVSSFK